MFLEVLTRPNHLQLHIKLLCKSFNTKLPIEDIKIQIV